MTKVGLLPLYIELYDKSSPEMRPGVEAFRDAVKEKLSESGLEVILADICRLENEFDKAVDLFEKEKVDAIITLHLAYSPSLESEKALKKTNIPILVLDTTPDYDFCHNIDSIAFLYNHGIHGVQDMCNILKRNGKTFKIFTGHYEHSDVIKQISDAAKAISAASRLKNGVRIGKIGKQFKGMGDFLAPEKDFEKLGITAFNATESELTSLRDSVTDAEIKAEYDKDICDCRMDGIDYEDYKNTERIGLAVRKWIETKKLDGFTMNFQSAGEMKGFDTMPFSEASKAMARGTGYAGEGDILTAALMSAFIPYFENTGFVEMFCPDWKGNSLFLNHMGEANLNLLECKKMIIKDFPYGDAFNPTCIIGHMKGGKVCLINIAPDGKGSFSMVFANGTMLNLPENIGSFSGLISGWFKPDTELREFLKKYSENGATHHSIMIYGAQAESLSYFAECLGLDYKVL